MTLYEMVKKYGAGKGEDMMWKTLRIMSDHMENTMGERDIKHMMRDLYGIMSSGHYNQEYAIEDVSEMYYIDANGNKQKGPYWSDETIKVVYDKYKREIPQDYNCWDFYVTMNMMKADNCPLLRRWFPDIDDSNLEMKYIELTINYFNDMDNPYGFAKIWNYLNG